MFIGRPRAARGDPRPTAGTNAEQALMGVRAIVRMATFMSLFRLLAVLLAIGTAQAVDLHVDPCVGVPRVMKSGE